LIALSAGIFLLVRGFFPTPVCAAEKKAFDIPAESAEQSVRKFVEQAGLSVLYESGRLTPFHTHALRGDFEPIEALRMLLDGSGLVYSILNPRVISIDPAPASTPSALAAGPARVVRDLPTVRIVSRRDPSYDPSLPPGSGILRVSDVDLARQGFSTIADWARSLPQNQGSGATEDTFAFQREAGTNTGRGAGINLYGIGQRATLILVNGRRLAPSGSAGTFTDVTNLPISAVDHIDILSDSAATLYGADAAGGIINIVLHDPSSPSITAGSLSNSPGGPLGEKAFSQMLTREWTRFGGLLSFEYYSRQELPAFDRSQGTSDLSPWHGTNFDSLMSNPATIFDSQGRLWGVPSGQDGTALKPAQLLPGPNLSDGIAGTWLLPHQERLNLLASATWKVADDWNLFFNSLLNRRRIEAVQAPLKSVLSVPSTNPFYLNPVSGDQSPLTVLYDFGKDLGPITENGQIASGQLALGFDHPLSPAWSLRGYFGYAFEDQHLVEHNLVNFGVLQDYLANPVRSAAFNPFADGSNTNSDTLKAIRADGWLKYDSAYTYFNLSTSGAVPIPFLSAGPAAVTAGYEYRVQSLESTVNPSLASTTLIQSIPTNSDRTVSALFLLTTIPVLRPDTFTHFPVALDISGGVRYEHFSDASQVATPSVRFELQPQPGVRLKGAWARFFRPPNLTDLNESANLSQIRALPDPSSPTGVSRALVWTGNNASLRAETARSWSLGADYSPPSVPEISVGLNYFHIFASNQVIPIQELSTDVFSNPQYNYLVTRNLSAAQRADVCKHSQFFGPQDQCLGAQVDALVDLRIHDVGSLMTDGLDFSAKYAHETTSGMVGGNLSATWTSHFKVADAPDAPLISYRNTPHYPMNLRFRSSFSWDWRGFFTSPAVNFQSGYVDNVSEPNRTVNPWVTWDLVVGYNIRLRHPGRLSVSLRGLNLFNQQPPFLNNNLSTVGYDPENGDLLGRRVSLAFEYRR
jgi:iron complex outermembrane recepter protein